MSPTKWTKLINLVSDNYLRTNVQTNWAARGNLIVWSVLKICYRFGKLSRAVSVLYRENITDIKVVAKIPIYIQQDATLHSLTFLLLPTWYTNFLFIHVNYIKLNSSTCFERNPLIIRRSTMQIVHMQPLVSSLCKSELSKLLR